jgi:hypothetical protein
MSLLLPALSYSQSIDFEDRRVGIPLTKATGKLLSHALFQRLQQEVLGSGKHWGPGLTGRRPEDWSHPGTAWSSACGPSNLSSHWLNSSLQVPPIVESMSLGQSPSLNLPWLSGILPFHHLFRCLFSKHHEEHAICLCKSYASTWMLNEHLHISIAPGEELVAHVQEAGERKGLPKVLPPMSTLHPVPHLWKHSFL